MESHKKGQRQGKLFAGEIIIIIKKKTWMKSAGVVWPAVTCAMITGDVSLDEGSAASAGRVDQGGCDALGAGCLQRLISTQEPLWEERQNRLLFFFHPRIEIVCRVVYSLPPVRLLMTRNISQPSGFCVRICCQAVWVGLWKCFEQSLFNTINQDVQGYLVWITLFVILKAFHLKNTKKWVFVGNTIYDGGEMIIVWPSDF